MKITLCMIVKDEEKYIRTCLENAFSLADEAVIVDTGSTDRTKEIIREFGNKVTLIESEWEQDFAKMRNIALEKATGEWILRLDADEKLICNAKKLRDILINEEHEGYRVKFANILENNQILYSENIIMLFKNNKYKYFGAVHEQLYIDSGKVSILNEDTAHVMHYGYLDESIKSKNKIERNMKILKNQLIKKPKNPYINYQIGATYFNDKKYKEALTYFLECDKLSKGKDLGDYHFEMFKYIAGCLYELKKYYECINFVNKLIAKDFLYKYTDLHFTKAHCYLSIGEYKEAVEVFKECISVGECKNFVSDRGKGSYLPKLMIARIYAKLNNINEAVKWYVEGVFDSNNNNKVGLSEFKHYLNRNQLEEVKNELNLILGDEP